jgi:DNA-binding MarR family transcriptional regulator
MAVNFDPTLPPDQVSANWIKAILKARRRREAIFGRELFYDAAWDILLELYSCELANEQIIISDLCSAAAIRATTGLRWLTKLDRAGLVVRTTDAADRKRVFVKLSPQGLRAMKEYFSDHRSGAVAV